MAYSLLPTMSSSGATKTICLTSLMLVILGSFNGSVLLEVHGFSARVHPRTSGNFGTVGSTLGGGGVGHDTHYGHGRLSPLKMADVKTKGMGIIDETTGQECVPEDEYCAVDKKTGKLIRLTVEEKERIFLDSLQSYYASGRQMLSDAEFDLLKEDLQWNGSDVVNLNRREAQYLGAMQAFLVGDPIMSDGEFDQLKNELRESGSKFAVDTEPKCYIDTGICKVTLQEDIFRSNLLYVPVVAALTALWLGPIFEAVALAIRFNPLVFLLLGAYPIYILTPLITENFIFQDFKIAYGPCPSCEAENRVYFGDILFTDGFKDVAEVKCPNCKTLFRVQRDTLRASTLPKA